jgi:thiamine phosphate synthase YjbQ (UPF0047 family)
MSTNVDELDDMIDIASAPFTVNLSTSVAKTISVATAEVILTLKKNGLSIGTVTFAESSTTGTIAIPNTSDRDILAGDILTLTIPGVDATLNKLAVLLRG